MFVSIQFYRKLDWSWLFWDIVPKFDSKSRHMKQQKNYHDKIKIITYLYKRLIIWIWWYINNWVTKTKEKLDSKVSKYKRINNVSRLAYEHHSYQITGTNFQAAIKSKSYRYVYLHLMESFAPSKCDWNTTAPIPLSVQRCMPFVANKHYIPYDSNVGSIYCYIIELEDMIMWLTTCLMGRFQCQFILGFASHYGQPFLLLLVRRQVLSTTLLILHVKEVSLIEH